MLPNSEGRDVFPCDFRAKIDFFALNDCLCVIIMENHGVQFFRLLEPILWALFQGHAHFCTLTTLLTLVVLFLLLKLTFTLYFAPETPFRRICNDKNTFMIGIDDVSTIYL